LILLSNPSRISVINKLAAAAAGADCFHVPGVIEKAELAAMVRARATEIGKPTVDEAGEATPRLPISACLGSVSAAAWHAPPGQYHTHG
jgi:hypothetical protein